MNISSESSQNLKYLRNDFDEASQKESLPTTVLFLLTYGQVRRNSPGRSRAGPSTLFTWLKERIRKRRKKSNLTRTTFNKKRTELKNTTKEGKEET